jgi:hypothetical protein
MNDTPTPETGAETKEAWAAVSRTPDGMYDSRIPISAYAYAMNDHSRKMERERDEMKEQCDLLTEQLDFQRNLSREYIDLNTGWRNKWECAVEMAALATVERDEWSQRATRYAAERESNAMQAMAYKSERDAALDALRKWDAVCVAADVCNAEMESDECSQTQWEAFEKKHADLLESANRARLAVLFPENSHAHPPDRAG